jgi:hypothetical protein
LSALHLQGSQKQYICALPPSKQVIDWDFIPEVKPSKKNLINLEAKKLQNPP